MRIALLAQFTLLKLSPQPPNRLAIAIAVTVLGSISGTFAQAQEVRNAIRDYRDERVFDYRPDDPQYRGKVFNAHTGHYGSFYNCDSQEDKRHSPYICWKPHHENDFPARLGFCENLRRDIAEIKQRISDGAGPCGSSCNCRECQPNQWQQTSQPHQPVYQSDCSCAQCSISGNATTIAPVSTELVKGSIDSESARANAPMRTQGNPSSCDCPSCKLKANSKPSYTEQTTLGFTTNAKSQGQTAQAYKKRRYGLVSGKIFQPRTVAPIDIVQKKTAPQTDRRHVDAKHVDAISRLRSASAAQKVPAPTSTRVEQSLQDRSKEISPVQRHFNDGPRVVERTDFWRQFKVF